MTSAEITKSLILFRPIDILTNARKRWEVGVHAPTNLSHSASQQSLASGAKLTQLQLDESSHLAPTAQVPNSYKTIISNSRIHILENASLVIRDVNKQDAGFYLCQAANNFGTLSKLVKLTVNGKFDESNVRRFVSLCFALFANLIALLFCKAQSC